MEREPLDVILKIWKGYTAWVKTIVKMAKAELRKDQEESLLLDGLKKLMVQISGQNTDNIGKVVDAIKHRKEESTGETAHTARAARLTKPAKVPSWTNDISLETYVKQIETWDEVNEDVPPITKYQDFVESLKTNKEIQGLPWLVGEHMLPVLEK